METDSVYFLKSLGFPELKVHHSFNHFDFTRPSRRILVIGPMGSGKTEYSSRVWRDSVVARKKSEKAGRSTTTGAADRRNVFFVRSMLDAGRFPEYPEDALAYRGGYDRCGQRIAHVNDSFELEELLRRNPEIGTWIIDEASFYDERLVYVILEESKRRGLVFIFPTLILNFRKDIFNSTARLMLETATDVFPLTAYCEHHDCLIDSYYTYRYYTIDGKECPALYFDPLIIIGGDAEKEDPRQPNYCTRCDRHHYLPGKDYSFLHLKPLGVEASAGNIEPLKRELRAIKNDIKSSRLYSSFAAAYLESDSGDANGSDPINMNALEVPCIAEKALVYLFAEQNLLTRDQLLRLSDDLELDWAYMSQTLADNRRPVRLAEG
jgi:thymidine kinase